MKKINKGRYYEGTINITGRKRRKKYMRMRRRKWTEEELNNSEFYIQEPEKYINKWNEVFAQKQPIYIELGCGKGNFIANLASTNVNTNFIAIDLIDTMLGFAKRNIENVYNDKDLKIDNVKLTRYNIEQINNIIGKEDNIQRIYINFCNPWPKAKHKKKRLTYPKQLELYKTFLGQNAEIHFKTDNDELFEDSIQYLQQNGFEIIRKTYDLHSANWKENIETEHEKMFTKEGIKIKALIAKIL